jgi:hypothetical protein
LCYLGASHPMSIRHLPSTPHTHFLAHMIHSAQDLSSARFSQPDACTVGCYITVLSLLHYSASSQPLSRRQLIYGEHVQPRPQPPTHNLHIPYPRNKPIALFSDTNCRDFLRGLEGPNGYPNGICTDLRRNGPYGSFQVVGLDPRCTGAAFLHIYSLF